VRERERERERESKFETEERHVVHVQDAGTCGAYVGTYVGAHDVGVVRERERVCV